MKIKFKTVLVFLAFIAAGSLAFDSYADCKSKCLRKAFCRVVMSGAKSCSCCQTEVQPKKTPTEKGKGTKTCCFKKTSPAATVDEQVVSVTNHIHPVYVAGAILTQSNFIPETVCLSTGPPFQFSDRRQSVLCVFII